MGGDVVDMSWTRNMSHQSGLGTFEGEQVDGSLTL